MAFFCNAILREKADYKIKMYLKMRNYISRSQEMKCDYSVINAG